MTANYTNLSKCRTGSKALGNARFGDPDASADKPVNRKGVLTR